MLAAGLTLALAGCGGDDEPKRPEAAPTETTVPVYAADMDPVMAAMTLVPANAKTLAVTDYDEVKSLFGLDDVTGKSSPAKQDDLWSRAVSRGRQHVNVPFCATKILHVIQVQPKNLGGTKSDQQPSRSPSHLQRITITRWNAGGHRRRRDI